MSNTQISASVYLKLNNVLFESRIYFSFSSMHSSSREERQIKLCLLGVRYLTLLPFIHSTQFINLLFENIFQSHFKLKFSTPFQPFWTHFLAISLLPFHPFPLAFPCQDQAVGKSCIARRFVQDVFTANIEPTVG